MQINEKQLKTMIDMQGTMNQTINTQWVTLGWDYMRASCLEGAEAIEHHGWKWWKAQKKDVEQLQMEIVDIWHFYLSRYLQIHQGDVTLSLAAIITDNKEPNTIKFDDKEYHLDDMDTLSKLDLLVGLSAAKRMSLPLISSLFDECDLDWDNLFVQYVKKNMLNIFRQKHGYKEGTYHKEWFGKEDNVYLLIEADKLNPQDDDYASKLWSGLESTYTKALEQRAKDIAENV